MTEYNLKRIREKFNNSRIREVIDASERVTIKVTSEDCSSGISADGMHCALANAACHNGFDEAVIMRSMSYLRKGLKVYRYKTPASVAREITAFDRGADFAPGTYHLAPVSPTNRMGHHVRKSGNGKSKSKRVTPTRHITSGIRAEW